MRLRLPHFANALLFRISATFLLMLGIVLGGYYFWIEQTVFNPFVNEAEEDWYENASLGELADLAGNIATATAHGESLLVEYGHTISAFDVELAVFSHDGTVLYTAQQDSQSPPTPAVDPHLLQDMTSDEWDFSSFPLPTDVDAYENRIFAVDLIAPQDQDTSTQYLVTSFPSSSMMSSDLNNDAQMIAIQTTIMKALLGLLIYSAISALLIMAWTSRRVHRLSDGVEAFAAGDLGRRVPARSTDEIGTLARNFNDMAASIESMVDKLRAKEEFQRQLIANMSHDLRTPMASMRGYVETLLMDDGQLERRQQERYLKIITGNLDHLNRLIEHMLLLSRFDSGQANFQMETFPLGELADSILLRFEGLAAERSVHLDLAVADDVGLVRAAPLQIAQVLQNLLENAIKFNRPGGSVVVGITRQNELVKVEVRDTGRGIPADDLPQIFERFFTADRSRTRQMADPDSESHESVLGQNTGLGLAIAAKITLAHGSRLRVTSQLGSGSCFSFDLPRVTEEYQDSAAAD